MSDLISRRELLKEIEKYKFGAISNDAEREYIKKTILDFIICQPTAYDIDKVVEEFERKMEEVRNTEYSTDTFVNESIRTIVINTIFDEEQGLLLWLPTEAYFIKNNNVCKGWVQEVVYSVCRKLLLDIRYDDNSLDSYRGYLGNDVFFTQSEADQKLEEMNTDNGITE